MCNKIDDESTLPVDGETEGRGASEPPQRRWCGCRRLAEERHEPSDGGTGEREMGSPQYPRCFILCKSESLTVKARFTQTPITHSNRVLQ